MPVQALIDAAEQASNIYDTKFISQSFVHYYSIPKECAEDMQEVTEVVINTEQDQEHIDLSLALENDLMPIAAIMHDSGPAFVEIMPDQIVHWF